MAYMRSLVAQFRPLYLQNTTLDNIGVPLFLIGVTDYRGHLQTVLPVWGINLKACALLIFSQIIWHSDSWMQTLLVAVQLACAPFKATAPDSCSHQAATDGLFNATDCDLAKYVWRHRLCGHGCDDYWICRRLQTMSLSLLLMTIGLVTA